MWKLTIEDDEGETREVDLVRDGYTIGRAGSCDVYLPERNVSRRHARLERDGEGRWWLVDLGSPYGSFVNGFRVEGRAPVTPSDVVQVGDHWLGLASEGPAGEGVAAEPAGERTPLPWGVRDEPDRLLVFDGPDHGRKVRLDAGPVLLGVGEGVTIRLPDAAAPPGVCALVRPLAGGRYEIVRRVDAVTMRVRRQPCEQALLEDDDVVRFEAPEGNEVMALRFCAARRVRHGTLTPLTDLAGLGPGRRLDPASLPTLETVEASLRDLPSWWRLEGESVWPRPEGYRAPPVRFTDVTNEVATAPTPPALAAPSPAEAGPPAEATPGPAEREGGAVVPPRGPRESARRERDRGRTPRAVARVVVALGLLGAAWAVGRRVSGPEAGAAGGPVAPAGARAATIATGGETPAVSVRHDAVVVAPSAATAAGSVAAPSAPTPTRPGTSARSVAPRRSVDPTRQPVSTRAGGDEGGAREHLREACRAYAARIARGEASPEIVQFHRAHCL